jgi:hypothetical protein
MNVSEISKESILSSLIEFGRINAFHVVHYLDSHTFKKENKFSQEDQQDYIHKIHEECEEYASSMIIYDLDSIVEISISKPDSKKEKKNYFGNSLPNDENQIGNQEVLKDFRKIQNIEKNLDHFVC